MKAARQPAVLDLVRDVEHLRRRVAEQEEELEEAEQRLCAEERRARRARRTRLTSPEIDRLEATPSSNRVLRDAACDELRDIVLGAHDRAVLVGIHDRLDGYERDLVERLLDITAPRAIP